jgi:hypothetical protein
MMVIVRQASFIGPSQWLMRDGNHRLGKRRNAAHPQKFDLAKAGLLQNEP